MAAYKDGVFGQEYFLEILASALFVKTTRKVKAFLILHGEDPDIDTSNKAWGNANDKERRTYLEAAELAWGRITGKRYREIPHPDDEPKLDEIVMDAYKRCGIDLSDALKK